MDLPQRSESLSELIQIMKERGFTEDFTISREGLSVSGSTGRYSENNVELIEHHRFEGTSNPDDMAVVYGIQTSDGKKGVVVDAFGVYSDPIVSEFMKTVEKRKASGSTNPEDEIKPKTSEEEISKGEKNRVNTDEK